MTCNEFHQVLPEIVDGASSAEQQAHLKSCPACSGLVSDLNAISQQARLLRASEEPSPRLWNSLEIALREEGLIRQPQREPSLAVVPASRRWRPAAWLVPVAAVLLVAFGLIVSKRTPVSPQGTQQSASKVSQAQPAGALSDREDQQLLEMVGSRTPGLRAAYESDLRNVNAYIRDAEQSVQADPNDEEAQQALMDAYGQKAAVYQLAMDRSLP